MTDEQDFFVPERVDEQIDHLSRQTLRYRLLRSSAPTSTRAAGRQVREARSIYRLEKELEDVPRAEARLIEDLRNYYWEDQQEVSLSLERAWKDIMPRLAISSSARSATKEKRAERQERSDVSQQQNPLSEQASEPGTQGSPWRWLGLIVAGLVMLILFEGISSAFRVRVRDSLLSDK
jgi:hypothetical protein